MKNQTLNTTEAAQAFAQGLNAFAVHVLEPLLAEDRACVILAQGEKDNLKERDP